MAPWDYDRRVPILFWRKGVTGMEQPQPVKRWTSPPR
jgi:hypothetical protein